MSSRSARPPHGDNRPDSLIINADVLRFLLRYDPDTGLFFWRHRRSGVASDRPAGTLKDCYIVIRIFNRFYQAQRLAWLYVHGEWPTKMVDHINRVPSDNRIGNLREADFAENAWNSTVQKPNATGFVGVRFRKNRNAYEASIRIRGRKRHLGLFKTAEEASRHRAFVARQMRGDFSPKE